MLKGSKAFSGIGGRRPRGGAPLLRRDAGAADRGARRGDGLMTLHLAGERPTLIYHSPGMTPASYTVLNFPVDDVDAAVEWLVGPRVEFERYEGMPQERERCDEGGRSRHRLVQGPGRQRALGAAGRLGEPATGASSRRTRGATSVPNSSIERITSAWGRVPTLNWIRKRSWPKSRVLGEDLLRHLVGVADEVGALGPAARLRRRRGSVGGQPRSRPIRSIIRGEGAGRRCRRPPAESSATKPCELMLSAGPGRGRPRRAASRWISANGAKRGRLAADDRQRHRQAEARRRGSADCGEPPTATQTGSGSCSGRG